MNLTRPHTLSLGGTDRRDNWWIGPAATGIGLILFVIYATYAGISNANYTYGPYLSPFYSPLLEPSWMPKWMSPAVLILGAPAGFRATCYYYRKAYYRAFFMNPPACAVGKGKSQGYTGERAFPFILQNLHRFFLYLAILVWAILVYDAFQSFYWPLNMSGAAVVDPIHNPAAVASHAYGIGIGTIVMFVNVILLACYTFGCHSLRHLIGGKIDCFSCQVGGKARHSAWLKVTWLNERHQLFAWLSLFSVGFVDVYIRLVVSGVISDHTIFFGH